MAQGVRNVIEMTNRYMGRNAQFMLDVMRETASTWWPVPVITDAFFPQHVGPAACRTGAEMSMKLNRVSMARS
ncbi:phosphotriesterase-like protein [Escherichia coli]|uniref:Phosphotriesterase-like protein n=1 Tax=Escherichia coli TaxID=562 RepID=A0A377DAD8_ECOLX|nr:phosphotriesterase-like protein [Escherichia coli]